MTDPLFWRIGGALLAAAIVGPLASRLALRLEKRRAAATAERDAALFFERGPARLLGLAEIFAALGPEQIAAQMVKVVAPRLERLADEVMLEQDPGLWRSTPELVKKGIYSSVTAGLPAAAAGVLADAAARIEELADYRELVLGRLAADPGLLERLRAARDPGAFCELLAAELLSGRAIVAALFHGSRHAATEELMRRHLEPIVFGGLTPLKAGLEIAIGRERLRGVREWAVAKSAGLAKLAFDDWHFHRGRCAEIALLLRRRLDALPEADKAAVLRAAGRTAWWPMAAALGAALLAGWVAYGLL